MLCKIAFYIPLFFALAILRRRQIIAPAIDREPFIEAMRIGMRHAAKVSLITNSLIITGLVAFVVRGVLEVLLVIADGVFEKGPVGLGLLLSSAGFGALLTGVAKTLIPAQPAGHISPDVSFIRYRNDPDPDCRDQRVVGFDDVSYLVPCFLHYDDSHCLANGSVNGPCRRPVRSDHEHVDNDRDGGGDRCGNIGLYV